MNVLNIWYIICEALSKWPDNYHIQDGLPNMGGKLQLMVTAEAATGGVL